MNANGLDRSAMTGTSSTTSDNITWLSNVATCQAQASQQRAGPPSGLLTSLPAGSAAPAPHDHHPMLSAVPGPPSVSSLFRPPPSLTEAAQRLYAGNQYAPIYTTSGSTPLSPYSPSLYAAGQSALSPFSSFYHHYSPHSYNSGATLLSHYPQIDPSQSYSAVLASMGSHVQHSQTLTRSPFLSSHLPAAAAAAYSALTPPTNSPGPGVSLQRPLTPSGGGASLSSSSGVVGHAHASDPHRSDAKSPPHKLDPSRRTSSPPMRAGEGGGKHSLGHVGSPHKSDPSSYHGKDSPTLESAAAKSGMASKFGSRKYRFLARPPESEGHFIEPKHLPYKSSSASSSTSSSAAALSDEPSAKRLKPIGHPPPLHPSHHLPHHHYPGSHHQHQHHQQQQHHHHPGGHHHHHHHPHEHHHQAQQHQSHHHHPGSHPSSSSSSSSQHHHPHHPPHHPHSQQQQQQAPHSQQQHGRMVSPGHLPPPPPLHPAGYPAPHHHHPPSSHPHYPPHFTRGSIIQLANGELKRVEDLRTDDFVTSADVSGDLKIDSSTVVRIEENLERGTALLGFSVGEHRVQVTVEATLEHPFFVFGQGWSSCQPERTLHRYGLSCHKVSVGDVCISLTHRDVSSRAAELGAQQRARRTSSSSSSNQISAGSTSGAPIAAAPESGATVREKLHEPARQTSPADLSVGGGSSGGGGGSGSGGGGSGGVGAGQDQDSEEKVIIVHEESEGPDSPPTLTGTLAGTPVAERSPSGESGTGTGTGASRKRRWSASDPRSAESSPAATPAAERPGDDQGHGDAEEGHGGQGQASPIKEEPAHA